MTSAVARKRIATGHFRSYLAVEYLPLQPERRGTIGEFFRRTKQRAYRAR
jgi:hypothetical protein